MGYTVLSTTPLRSNMRRFWVSINIGTALAEAGGTFDDVAKLTVYVVDRTHDEMPLLLEGMARATKGLGVTPVPRPHCWASPHWTYPSIWSRSR